MNLCSNNHKEICYENEPCPLYEAVQQIKDLETEKENLQEEIDNV